jgi:hypothetical protein
LCLMQDSMMAMLEKRLTNLPAALVKLRNDQGRRLEIIGEEAKALVMGSGEGAAWRTCS